MATSGEFIYQRAQRYLKTQRATAGDHAFGKVSVHADNDRLPSPSPLYRGLLINAPRGQVRRS